MKKVFGYSIFLVCLCLFLLAFSSCGKTLSSFSETQETSASELNTGASSTSLSAEVSDVSIESSVFQTDGTNLFLTVPNNTETFSFDGTIVVTNDASWQVSTDEFGLNTSLTKTFPLVEGDNTFYLFIVPDEGAYSYCTISIHRTPALTISDGTLTGISEAFKTNPHTMLDLTSASGEEPITAIGDSVFRNCTGLTSIIIPDSIEAIGADAFQGCAGLVSVYYSGNIAGWCNILFENGFANPLVNAQQLYLNGSLISDEIVLDTITVVQPYSFYGFSGVASIVVGENVASIGDQAFACCTNLSKLSVAKENAVYCSKDNCLIETESGALIKGGNNSAVQLDETITSIEPYAFCGCSDLRSIAIPNSVLSIGKDAFSDCSMLSAVVIGNNVKIIGNSAFDSCPSLKSVFIPSSIETVEEYAFSGANDRSGLCFTYSGTIEQWDVIARTLVTDFGVGCYTVECANGDLHSQLE